MNKMNSRRHGHIKRINISKGTKSLYLNDVLTVPASLAGLPAISISSGFNKEQLPVGLQIIGKPFDEVSILGVAKTIEDSRGF